MAGNIFSVKNLAVLVTVMVLLGLYRFSMVSQINSSVELQSEPVIPRADQSLSDSGAEALKHISENIGEIKTLTADKKVVQDLIKEPSPKSDTNPSDIKQIVNEAIKGQLTDFKEDLKKEFKTSAHDMRYDHGIFRKNERIVEGSAPPFQKYQNYRLIWFCTVRNNYINAKPPMDMGGAGFAAEAIDFIIPLCKKYPFFGWVEEVEAEKWKESFLFQGLPTYEQDLMEKCNERGRELLEMDHIPGIGVLQYTPSDYARLRNGEPNLPQFKEHIGKMKYIVGRTMFETNNLPPGWADLINNNINEMWVPTQFHVNVFTTHGVTVKVKAIGEGFDPVRFNSDSVTKSRAALFPECNEDDFIFLAASEFIDRKGFDHLFEAYATGFTSDDKVCIAVRASGLDKLNFENPQNLRRDKVGKLTNDEYAQFYKSGDAFVSASHGEGWGRTTQEAMAMGLPVILPVWGGVTGYARDDVVISVKVDGLEQAFPDKPDNWLLGKEKVNHKWAKVQVPRIRAAMQWAYNNQEKAEEIGDKAKVYMRTYFTRAKFAEDVLRRTDTIFESFNKD